MQRQYNGRARITKELVEAIRVALFVNPRLTMKNIADAFGVSKQTVMKVQHGGYDAKFGKNEYQTFYTAEVAEMIGVTTATVINRARRLGIIDEQCSNNYHLRFTDEEADEISRFHGDKRGRKPKKTKGAAKKKPSESLITIKDIASREGVTKQTVRRWVVDSGLGELLNCGSKETITFTKEQANVISEYARTHGNPNVRKYNWDRRQVTQETNKDAQLAYKDAQIACLECRLKATQEALELAQANASKPGFFARLFSKKA